MSQERDRINEDLGERLAVVETELKQTNKTLENVHGSLEKLEKEITHYKGMVGGVIFIVTALAAAFQLLKEWMFNR